MQAVPHIALFVLPAGHEWGLVILQLVQHGDCAFTGRDQGKRVLQCGGCLHGKLKGKFVKHRTHVALPEHGDRPVNLPAAGKHSSSTLDLSEAQRQHQVQPMSLLILI